MPSPPPATRDCVGPGGRRGILFILLLSLAPWAPSLPGRFLYDDFSYVVDHPLAARIDLSAALASPYVPQTPQQGLYRPLAVVSAGGDILAWGLNPVGHHVTNILLNAAVALAVAALARVLGAGMAGAAAAGALFGAHAQHAEVVGWISGRSELLASLLGTVAILCQARADTSRRPVWDLAALLAWVLALEAKESAVVVPILALAISWARRRARSRDWVARGAACLVVLLGWSSLRWHLFAPRSDGATHEGALEGLGPARETSPVGDRSLPSRLGLLVQTQGYQLQRLVWPVRLSVATHAGMPDPRDPGYVLGASLLVGALALPALALARGRRDLAAMGAWYWIAQIPTLNLVPIGETFAERFLYLPSAGACLAAAVPLARSRTARTGTLALLGLLAAIRADDWGGGRCFARAAAAEGLATQEPRGDPTRAFWALSLREEARDVRAHLGYAIACGIPSGRAETSLRRALAVAPSPYALHFFAYARDKAGAPPQEVRDLLEEVVRAVPYHARARDHLAATYERLGMHDEALAQYGRIEREQPDFPDIQYQIGRVLRRTDPQAAFAYLAGAAHPATGRPAPRAKCLLAQFLWDAGERETAHALVEHALRIVDDQTPAQAVSFREKVAEEFQEAGHYALAEQCLRDGAERFPLQPKFAFNLGLVLAAQEPERNPEAVAWIRRAAAAGYRVPAGVWEALGEPPPR